MLKSGLIIILILFFASNAEATPKTCAIDLESRMETFLQRTQLILRLLTDFWGTEMRARKIPFQPPRLHFYSEQADTPCGPIRSSMGPLYCSTSRSIYLDSAWFFEDSRHTGVPAHLSVVFVLAHEYSHHISQITGLFVKMLDATLPKEDHALTARMNELTMDGWAGIFIAHIFKYQVLDAAEREQIEKYVYGCGDHENGGCLHGTGAERLSWFRKGSRARRLEDLNAFKDSELFDQASRPTKAWISDVLFAP